MENNYNPIYGGVTFEEFEAAGQKVVEYLSGLAVTVQIRDMVRDEIRKSLKKDLMMASLIDLAINGARTRFVSALNTMLKEASETSETSETLAKTEPGNTYGPTEETL